MKAVLKAGVVVLVLHAGGALAREEEPRSMSVMVGGGVEGYTRDLAPQVDVGVTYGVSVGMRANRLLGLELGYSGAVNGLELGADLVRNGAYAAATVDLRSSGLRPYVMGGLGFSTYNVRGGVPGFGDDTVGNVPLGAGVHTSLGAFTADARLNYNILFDQQFAVGAPVPNTGGPSRLHVGKGGRYSGTLNLGMAW
ncbi:MAG TPA: outer membrane beta-barrel protein [Archangium sp.]|jgi:hypothetical protein|uniref:outer membrane beta-barrel protein n=1 Tax=Archangium sp. TaxID=1872627 RepID=UPI002EDA5351